MQRVLMLSVSIAVMTWAASAGADSPKLKGDYGFTGSATCIVSDTAFTGIHPTLGSSVWIESFAVQGTRTFDGNGGGTVTGHSMSVELRPAHSGASSADFQFSFNYSVDGNGGWASAISGFLTGTVMTGGRTGQTFNITGFPAFAGLISQNGSTLTAFTPDPTVETVTYSNGDVDYRICNRSRVLISLPHGDQ